MGTLTASAISTTYKNLLFQKTDNKLYYTNVSDVDTEVTTFASPMTFTGLGTFSNGIQLGSGKFIKDSGGNEAIGVTTTGSAITYLQVVPGATGNPATLTTAGETNVGLTLDGNGSGVVTSTPRFDATLGVKLINNEIYNSEGTLSLTLDTDEMLTIAGDLTVAGDEIIIGATHDATDKSILFKHDVMPVIMGIDDSQNSNSGKFILHSGNAFEATELNNDIILDASGNLTLGNGTLKTSTISAKNGSLSLTISDSTGNIAMSGTTTLSSNLIFTGAQDIIFTDADGLEVKDTGGSTYLALVSDTMTVSQPLTVSSTASFTSTATMTGITALNGNANGVAGVGITSGTGTICKSTKLRQGDVVYTNVILDVTGLQSDANGDVISKAGTTTPAFLTKITTANNGTILQGKVTCLEAPTADLEFFTSTDATLKESDVAATSAAYDSLCVKSTWAIGDVKFFDATALPANNEIIYMEGTAATNYSAGKFIIEMWGTV
tara:strand:+ start:32 stop:1513 length:1482 start_codon:yes stop_codon:yes gene_type:complete